MSIDVDGNILEEELQRVFKKLPNICCDTASLIFIIDTLDKAYYEKFGKRLDIK